MRNLTVSTSIFFRIVFISIILTGFSIIILFVAVVLFGDDPIGDVLCFGFFFGYFGSKFILRDMAINFGGSRGRRGRGRRTRRVIRSSSFHGGFRQIDVGDWSEGDMRLGL